MLRDRYDFTIVAARMRRDLPRREEVNGVPLVRIGFGFSVDKWLYPFLAPFTVRSLHPGIVHAVLESFAGAALIGCAIIVPGARRILTCQSTNTTFLLGPIHRAAHRVTAISSILVQRAERFRTSAELIPNGLKLSAMPRLEKVGGRVLFVGRLEAMKGVDTLLQAFAQLPSLVLGKSSLRIVGDGSLRHSLEALARELGISDRVRFLGYIPSPAVYREFAEAEIFCGLSRSEALGNVFLEAQAANCAVLASNTGGIPDIVKDRATGLLVPPDDVAATADALEKLLVDASLRMKLAAAGRFHAQEFDWGTIAERYAEVYEGVLLP